MTSIMKQNNFKKFIKCTAVLLLWLAVWQISAAAIGQELLIPSPLAAFKALIGLAGLSEFWLSVIASMGRILLGYLSGVIIGVIGAVLSARFSIFKAIFSPVLLLLRAVPVASFIILAFVFIKSDYLAIFISFLMVLPMIWSTTQSGIENLDVKYLEMAEIFNLGYFKTLFQIKIPFIMPSFIATATSSLGFAWKSGVAAEVICKPASSLGGMLADAKLFLETPNVFAITAVVAVLSLILELIIKAVARRFLNDKA